MSIKNKTWIIIPAFNEEKRIKPVLKKIKQLKINLIVIDDGSDDNTYNIAKKYTPYVLRHTINLGKGAAARLGCDYAIKKGAEYLILMDSDGQHEPEDIKKFIDKLTIYDLIFGSRIKKENMPFILKFGNGFLSLTTKILFGINNRDTQSGFRAFNKKTYLKIRWKSNEYEMESEMFARLRKHKLKYTEISIKTIYLDKHKGTTIFDGIKIFINMVWWRITI